MAETNKDETSDVLARTIWGEARGEGIQGMQAIASVILNRVKKGGWWGATIEEVCKKRNQFSCWNSNDPNAEKCQNITDSNPQFRTALSVAQYAVYGGLVDNTGGATHYHTRNIRPSWADDSKKTAVIGNHIFYKGIS